MEAVQERKCNHRTILELIQQTVKYRILRHNVSLLLTDLKTGTIKLPWEERGKVVRAENQYVIYC